MIQHGRRMRRRRRRKCFDGSDDGSTMTCSIQPCSRPCEGRGGLGRGGCTHAKHGVVAGRMTIDPRLIRPSHPYKDGTGAHRVFTDQADTACAALGGCFFF